MNVGSSVHASLEALRGTVQSRLPRNLCWVNERICEQLDSCIKPIALKDLLLTFPEDWRAWGVHQLWLHVCLASGWSLSIAWVLLVCDQGQGHRQVLDTRGEGGRIGCVWRGCQGAGWARGTDPRSGSPRPASRPGDAQVQAGRVLPRG